MLTQLSQAGNPTSISILEAFYIIKKYNMLKRAYNQGYEDAKLGHINDADTYSADVEYALEEYIENSAIAECDRVWGFGSKMEDAFIMGVKWALKNT